VWKWMDGPEAGQVFWNQACGLGFVGVCPATGMFNNWFGHEPNNAGGAEDALEIRGDWAGGWNDIFYYTEDSLEMDPWDREFWCRQDEFEFGHDAEPEDLCGPRFGLNPMVVEYSKPDGSGIAAFAATRDVALDIKASLYFPTVPARFADTRDLGTTVDGLGPKGVVGPDQLVQVPIAGRNGLPDAGVGAVAVNVTATGTTHNTYLTAFPTGEPRPIASTVNPAAGQTVPNMAIVKLGPDGSISVANHRGEVHVIVDVFGWFPEGSDYQATVPARFADTRVLAHTVDGLGPKSELKAGGHVVVPIADRNGLPAAGVGAVAVNVTATGTTHNTYLTAFPTGEPRPNASTLNPAAGQTVPNMAIVKLGPDGSISLANHRGEVHVIVDVLGWFPEESDYNATVPARFADTRAGYATVDGISPKGVVGAAQQVQIPVAGRHGLPATGVGAVVVNITATGPTHNTFITAFPTGQPRPNTSNLNPAAGQTVPNMAIIKLGPDGSITVENNRGDVHLIVDVLGWFPE